MCGLSADMQVQKKAFIFRGRVSHIKDGGVHGTFWLVLACFGLKRAILVSLLKVIGLKWSTTRAFAAPFKQNKDLRHCFPNHDE